MSIFFKYFLLVLSGILIGTNSYNQDTIPIGKRIEYYAAMDSLEILSHFGMNTFFRADYARELIRFDNDSAELENCFYYDGKRYLRDDRTFSFKRTGDSLISVYYKGYIEQWKYQKISDTLYRLTQLSDGFREVGYAKQLIPLEKTNDFYLMNMKDDTLCTIKYSGIVFPKVIPVVKPVSDSTYVLCEQMPTYKGGGIDKVHLDILRNMQINMPAMENSLNCTSFVMYFMIDKTGEVTNFRFIRGCDNGFMEKSILKTIYQLKKFTPGYMHGKPVNVEMTAPIHIDLY